MPKFCIVIPSSDNADTLVEAVETALSQTYADYRVVVSDNASGDRTGECLSRFEGWPRLSVHLHQFKLEKSQNWNRAFALAPDCDYLVNLHADDRLRPDCLATIAACLGSRPALVHGARRRITWAGQTSSRRRHFPLSYAIPKGGGLELLLVLGNPLSIVGAAIARRAFEAAGGWPEDYRFMQDVELWRRLGHIGETRYAASVFGDYREQRRPGVNLNYVAELTRWLLRVQEAGKGLVAWASAESLRQITGNLLKEAGEEAVRAHPQLCDVYLEARRRLDGRRTLPIDRMFVQRALRAGYWLRHVQ